MGSRGEKELGVDAAALADMRAAGPPSFAYPHCEKTNFALRLDSEVLKRVMMRGSEEVAELQRREKALGVEVDAAAAAYMRATAVTGRRHSVQTEVIHGDSSLMASVNGMSWLHERSERVHWRRGTAGSPSCGCAEPFKVNPSPRYQ